MKLLWFLSVVLSVSALMLVSAGCTRRGVAAQAAADPGGSAGGAAEEGQSEPVTAVPVLKPQRVPLERKTTQPATVYPNFEAKIYAKCSGYLKELRADIGQKVQKDEVLGVVWLPEMEKSLETQEKTVERLKAEEARAQAGVALAEADLVSSRGAVAQAQAEITKAQAQGTADHAEYQRIQELVSNKSVADRLLDEARKTFESSQAAQAAADASLAVAKAQVTVAEAKLQAAKADLKIAKAETAIAEKKLDELKTLMSYAELKAPFAGMVTERCVDPGDLVTQSTSGQPLFTVADVDTVRVRATVPEADVPWVREGAVATLNVAAIAGRGFTGKVSRIAGSVDESTRTMLVEVDLPNSTGELRPGMYGELTLVLEHKDNALVLPARVVRHDEQGHAFVYTVTSDNVVHKTAVVTGMDTGAEIEILSPLEGGERIVDATITTLNDGQRVSVQE